MVTKFWSVKNIIVSLKGIVSSILTGLVLIIPMGLVYWLRSDQRMSIAMIISLLTIPLYLIVWGYFGRKWWGWK